MRSIRSILLPLLTICCSGASANNIQVSNVTLSGQNTANNTWQVRFTVSWENSWRTNTLESNWDAAWIFIKFRYPPVYNWQHAVLSATGHTAPAGGTITVPADRRGAFLYRSANGIGNVNYTNVELQWNYGVSGVADGDAIGISVHAIEMVYSPQGSFSVGDGSALYNGLHAGATPTVPYQVTSEAQLTLGTLVGAVNANNNLTDDFNYGTAQVLPAAFPKGFNAFYAMKYEVTRGQYLDFLNKLTAAQGTARFASLTGAHPWEPFTSVGSPPAVYGGDHPDRPCAYLSVADMMAYADWAALRPLTELEFEKLCRGDRPPIAGEFAWGSANIRPALPPYAIGNLGQPDEIVTNPETGIYGNANYLNTTVSYRSGIFAASVVNPTRVSAGAGYTGAMELSGNLMERCVGIGSAAGRSFGGAIGDGELTVAGSADVAGWPTNTGIVFRGGSFGPDADPLRLRISNRALTSSSSALTGARLGRTP